MTKWFREDILIKYWEDNCKKYTLPDGRRILRAERNFPLSKYPDISKNELNSGEIVPCEIEWCTTNFYVHEHDIEVLRKNSGFLVTLIENSAFDVPQIIIDKNDLIKWFKLKAAILARETLADIINECKPRSDTFVWIIYVPKRAKKNYNIAQEIGIWGFNDSKKGKRRGIDDIKQIRANDIIVFLREFEFKEKTRTPWIKDVEKYVGNIKEIKAFRVSKGYYFDQSGVYQDNLYPHRFEFDVNFPPLFHAENVDFNPENFGDLLHRQIVNQINAKTIVHIDASMLLRLFNVCAISQNKKVNIRE